MAIPLPKPTRNPVPSTDIRDHVFAGAKLDEFIHSLAEQFIDRFGNGHYTLEGLKNIALQTIYNLGFNPKGSFQSGALLTAAGDIIQDETNLVWYRWDGISTLPKKVEPGSTPSTTGGISKGAWQPVDVSDVLRRELSGNSGASKIGVMPQGTLAEMQYYVTPDQFSSLSPAGKYVDENTDFTLPVRAAIRYASENPGVYVRGTDKVYLISQAEILVGVKKITGLKLKCSSKNGVMLYSQIDSGHDGLEISDCEFNANDNARGAILLSGIKNGIVTRNKVYGFNADGTERYGIRIGTTSTTSLNSYNTISENHIVMPVDPDGGKGTVGIAGIYVVSPVFTGQDGMVDWDQSYKTVQYTNIFRNICEGGTHNILTIGLFSADISENYLIGGTHRNINLSNGSERVSVRNNNLINTGSAGVIFGDCRFIQIIGNYIQSSLTSAYTSDDAAIQFAQSSYNVDVFNNTILGDWKYGIHIFNSKYVNIKSNSIVASIAGIAIESSQSLTLPNDAIYSQRRNISTGITGETSFFSISGNTFTLGPNACSHYLCQFANVVLANIFISDETINNAGNSRHVIYLCNANSLISGIQLSSVRAYGASETKYYSVAGRTPFKSIDNVTGLEDNTREVSFSGDQSPSVLAGPNIYISSGTITTFDDGINGQHISIRMAAGVVILNNASYIRLKGESNITSTSSNSILNLERRAGVWFEVSRNF